MHLSEGAAGLAANDRRFALKRATDDAHSRVEKIVQDAGMFSSRAAYLRYLRATWEMRARFEGLLDRNGAGELWTDWPERKIAGLVAQDITDLGGADLGRAVNARSGLTENVTGPLKPGELVGVLYVLEGSSLGARVLVKLATEMGLTPSFGARHLFRQAADRNAWRDFVNLMQSASEPPCHNAANRTFEAFAAAYSRHAAPAAA